MLRLTDVHGRPPLFRGEREKRWMGRRGRDWEERREGKL